MLLETIINLLLDFKYDFPNSYNTSIMVRRNMQNWISHNRNKNIKYILRKDRYDYEIYNVKILDVNYDLKKIYFREVY